jgi:hypothetical protein
LARWAPDPCRVAVYKKCRLLWYDQQDFQNSTVEKGLRDNLNKPNFKAYYPPPPTPPPVLPPWTYFQEVGLCTYTVLLTLIQSERERDRMVDILPFRLSHKLQHIKQYCTAKKLRNTTNTVNLAPQPKT